MTIAVSPDGLPALVLNADLPPAQLLSPCRSEVLAGRHQGGSSSDRVNIVAE